MLFCASTRSNSRLPPAQRSPLRQPSSVKPQLAALVGRASVLRRPVKTRQSQSKLVKVFPNRHLRATVPAHLSIYCGFPGHTLNLLRFAATAHANFAMQSAISVKPRPTSPIRTIRPMQPIPPIRHPPSSIRNWRRTQSHPIAHNRAALSLILYPLAFPIRGLALRYQPSPRYCVSQ